jgi:hypothetical protein
MRAGEMLVRRSRVALLPMVLRRLGTGLTADPQHLDGGHRRLLDPRCVGPRERVLNVLEHRSGILRKRIFVLLFSTATMPGMISSCEMTGKARTCRVSRLLPRGHDLD